MSLGSGTNHVPVTSPHLGYSAVGIRMTELCVRSKGTLLWYAAMSDGCVGFAKHHISHQRSAYRCCRAKTDRAHDGMLTRFDNRHQSYARPLFNPVRFWVFRVFSQMPVAYPQVPLTLLKPLSSWTAIIICTTTRPVLVEVRIVFR